MNKKWKTIRTYENWVGFEHSSFLWVHKIVNQGFKSRDIFFCLEKVNNNLQKK